METNDLGRNVGIKDKSIDCCGALKLYETNNYSSNDEDDPFNILRDKSYPKHAKSKCYYTKEKFTMPPISIGIRPASANTVRDANKNFNVNNKKIICGNQGDSEPTISNTTNNDNGDCNLRRRGRSRSKFHVERCCKNRNEVLNRVHSITDIVEYDKDPVDINIQINTKYKLKKTNQKNEVESNNNEKISNNGCKSNNVYNKANIVTGKSNDKYNSINNCSNKPSNEFSYTNSGSNKYNHKHSSANNEHNKPSNECNYPTSGNKKFYNCNKALVNRLVEHCRTLANEQIQNKENSNLLKDYPPYINPAILNWEPKINQLKAGNKLDIANLNIPNKVPNFNKLFKQFCNASCADMKVVIDDTVFHCHKIVLQCYSKYFQTHIRAKNIKKDVLIEIPHNKVNKNIFMDVYIWMLNSPKNCKQNFNNNNVLNILIAAAFLKIEELEKHCWHYITDKNHFDESIAFDLYWEARISNFSPVMELMVTRIKYFFLTLIQTERFSKLNETELHLFLDSNNIAVHNEIEVFFTLILWIRRRNLNDPWECSLFRLIRYSQISPIQLVELQSMNELTFITKRYPINEMIENGLKIAIRREHAYNNPNIEFNDPEPQYRALLKKIPVYKSFNDFIDLLLDMRIEMKKNGCELMRREVLENLKLPLMQHWASIAINNIDLS